MSKWGSLPEVRLLGSFLSFFFALMALENLPAELGTSRMGVEW